jgi:hypothetical protein
LAPGFSGKARPIDHPDVKLIFSTVHKFKGLECDTVRIAADFSADFPTHAALKPDPRLAEEFNLGSILSNSLFGR